MAVLRGDLRRRRRPRPDLRVRPPYLGRRLPGTEPTLRPHPVAEHQRQGWRALTTWPGAGHCDTNAVSRHPRPARRRRPPLTFTGGAVICPPCRERRHPQCPEVVRQMDATLPDIDRLASSRGATASTSSPATRARNRHRTPPADIPGGPVDHARLHDLPPPDRGAASSPASGSAATSATTPGPCSTPGRSPARRKLVLLTRHIAILDQGDVGRAPATRRPGRSAPTRCTAPSRLTGRPLGEALALPCTQRRN